MPTIEEEDETAQDEETPPPSRPPTPPPPPPPLPNYNRHVCPICRVMVKLTDKTRTCSCKIQDRGQGFGADYIGERLYLLDDQESPVGTIAYIRGLENHPLRGELRDIETAIDLVRRTNTRRPPDRMSSSDESGMEADIEPEDSGSSSCHGFSTTSTTDSEEGRPRTIRDEIPPEDLPEYDRILGIIQGTIPPEQPPKRRSTTRDDLLDQEDTQEQAPAGASLGAPTHEPGPSQQPQQQPMPQDQDQADREGISPGPIKTRSGKRLQRTPAFKTKRGKGRR